MKFFLLLPKKSGCLTKKSLNLKINWHYISTGMLIFMINEDLKYIA